MENKQIDILDVLLILAKHKKFISFVVMLVSIISVIYVMVVPKLWTSASTILPASEQSSSFNIGSSSFLGLGSTILGNAFQKDAEELVTIMKSRNFSEDVIYKYNLIDYFKIKDADSLVAMDIALIKLKETIRNVNIDDDSGLIIISISTKDKFLSADISNYYVKKLEKYNMENRSTKGKSKRIFIGKRLDEVRSELDSLSLAINSFKKENNTLDLETQSNAMITLYSDLIAQKIETEIELDYSSQFLSIESPKYKGLLNRKIAILKKIKEIEFSTEQDKIKFSLNLEEIPDLELQLSKLLIAFEIQKKLYTYLYPEYEEARIEEVKDLPTIEIIDKAVPAGLRSYPRRARMCVTNFIVAFILSIFLSFVIEYFQNNKERYRELLRHISKWK